MLHYVMVWLTSLLIIVFVVCNMEKELVETSMDSLNFYRVREKTFLLKEIPVKYNMKVNLIPYACFNVVHQKC